MKLLRKFDGIAHGRNVIIIEPWNYIQGETLGLQRLVSRATSLSTLIGGVTTSVIDFHRDAARKTIAALDSFHIFCFSFLPIFSYTNYNQPSSGLFHVVPECYSVPELHSSLNPHSPIYSLRVRNRSWLSHRATASVRGLLLSAHGAITGSLITAK